MNQPLLNAVSNPEEKDYNFPSVSIIMPFEPKMKSKRDLLLVLQSAVEKVERKIFDKFSADMALLVLQKLRSIIKDLDFSTYKKSIAIYVSPLFEKVLYLNMEVRLRILVNGFFHIRDLIKSKKHFHQYLLLQIGDKECRIYVNESGELEKIFSYKVENVNCPDSTTGEAESNHDAEIKDCKTEKFLHRIDNTLHFILESYHLPLFISGSELKLEQFSKITSHSQAIVEYIPYNNESATTEEIKKLMFPYVIDWRKVKQKLILKNLKAAMDRSRLASGIRDVYKAAIHHKGRLLLVEENYQYPTSFTASEEIIYKDPPPFNRLSYIKDVVDDIIEKVLDEGGDVEFVSEKIMGHYDHIALVL